jgi:hypothetical protein
MQMGMPQMPYMQPPAMPQQPVMPQMPYMAAPQMPQMAPPQVAMAPVPAPAAKSPNLLLIAIFCLLMFLAGGFIVYLLVKPK